MTTGAWIFTGGVNTGDVQCLYTHIYILITAIFYILQDEMVRIGKNNLHPLNVLIVANSAKE